MTDDTTASLEKQMKRLHPEQLSALLNEDEGGQPPLFPGSKK